MSNTLQVLGITWPKLIAQFINFSIVLFVLWRFAYRPVFAMLETRRLKIAEGIANAEKIKAQLAQAEADRREILVKAGDQANQIIAEVRVAEPEKALADFLHLMTYRSKKISLKDERLDRNALAKMKRKKLDKYCSLYRIDARMIYADL